MLLYFYIPEIQHGLVYLAKHEDGGKMRLEDGTSSCSTVDRDN